MIKELSETAKRARDLAAEKHRTEVNGLRSSLAAASADRVAWAGKYRKASTWKNLLLATLVVTCALYMYERFSSHVETSPPPALQKVQVVVYGYIDAKGIYRSYETGEPLNPQPLGWMP
jgi:hypothetical protein